MLEQLDSRGTSRRRMVRAGAWAVPAVSIAAAAPVFAASPVGYLEFNPGLSYVHQNNDDTYSFVFDGAAVWISGRDLLANELTMTATFVPDTGPAPDQLSVSGAAPAFFSAPPAGLASSAAYVSQLGVGSGDPIWISDGAFFGTALANVVGSFVLTFTVSAPGWQSATYTVSVPPL